MDNIVFHPVFGRCSVIAETENTIIIRTMDNSIQECLKSEISYTGSILDEGAEYSSIKTLLKVQSGLISSINDTWGIFSQTAIHLLPHQLWVCNRVMRQWPTRMLVADDVGLGKTIEAGIILLAAISSKRADRILILSPASLTQQWKTQMHEKFNLTFEIHSTASEKQNDDFWISHNRVIASVPTIRMDNDDRYKKICKADQWDLVIVDEAHHLGRSQKNTTLGYNFIKMLEDNGKINSMVFFTATPHQGVDENFWYLMKLLAPDDFSSENTVEKNYSLLRNHMIRNKKSRVIDMDGKPLFHGLKTSPYEFYYTEEESEFYSMMTAYIKEGFAYAKTANESEKRLIGLVLTALQKIASSSIRAIRIALSKRRRMLIEAEEKARKKSIPSNLPHDTDGNTVVEKPEEITLKLMNDEIKHLGELITSARKVTNESRICKIMEIIKDKFPSENILFFTEYKATQALMVEALRAEYGAESVSFINGDDKLAFSDGHEENSFRKDEMLQFQLGKKRFLVSTEAAGEGVDLQDSCHILVHVDIPWNPMRMQQRVGRVFRYGQKKDVEVVYAVNPDTIEAKIWMQLDHKIRNIMNAFNEVQGGDPEDLLDMVIGMHDASFYESLYTKASSDNINSDSVDVWFDKETQTFGEKNALDVLRQITGNAQSFDLSFLQEVPRLDINDLKPFMQRAVEFNNEKFRKSDIGYSFVTPSVWRKKSLNINKEYKDVVFTRESRNVAKICAVGNSVVNAALSQASAFKNNFAIISGKHSYIVIRVYERLTTERGLTKYIFIAYELSKPGGFKVIPDYELFNIVRNELDSGYIEYGYDKACYPADEEIIKKLCRQACQDYANAGVKFKIPESELFAYLQGVEYGRRDEQELFISRS